MSEQPRVEAGNEAAKRYLSDDDMRDVVTDAQREMRHVRERLEEYREQVDQLTAQLDAAHARGRNALAELGARHGHQL